jgi:hypothetical protein
MTQLPKKEMRYLQIKLYQRKSGKTKRRLLLVDQVRDVNRLEEVLESIDQELSNDIKASPEPISHLDNHYATVRRALKNQSSLPVLEQKRAKSNSS